jgi:hypothetical protein
VDHRGASQPVRNDGPRGRSSKKALNRSDSHHG